MFHRALHFYPAGVVTEIKTKFAQCLCQNKSFKCQSLAHFVPFSQCPGFFTSKVHGALFGEKGKPYQTLSVF